MIRSQLQSNIHTEIIKIPQYILMVQLELKSDLGIYTPDLFPDS